MNIYFQLFKTFFEIGAFTIGGGYAMLSMVERSVVQKKKWMTKDDFWDMIVVVQTIPGVFAVNTALYTGYRIKGMKGAICAALGAIIPSFVIICLVAMFFVEIRDNTIVERIFKGIRPCVVALILAPALQMVKSAKITLKTAVIPIGAVFLVWWCDVSPVYVIVASALGGVLIGAYSYYRISSK
ncbi:MAG: chromate transporter [Prevotellaceae bacterium]|jgi:chromate transporter|nr:chromate transporter [Prevotellaceae bacterium]